MANELENCEELKYLNSSYNNCDELQQQHQQQVNELPSKSQYLAIKSPSQSNNNTSCPKMETKMNVSSDERCILPQVRSRKAPKPATLLRSYSLVVALTIILTLLGDGGQQSARLTSRDEGGFKFERLGEKLISFLTGGGGGRVLRAANAQYSPIWPSKSLQQEIFLLNLEDGYFGCQVNESQDFLQLFELSKLCDGQTQCYLGTDEMSTPLKCNNRDKCGISNLLASTNSQAANSNNKQLSAGQSALLSTLAASGDSTNALAKLTGSGENGIYQCVNGVCLDGLCYCNDGWGGKSCDIPDENECKFRPCDVFAHCTNTMGSYYCSCFPGKFQPISFGTLAKLS